MDYQGFIATVEQTAHVDEQEAEKAACATLQTLAERLSDGEVEDLAERLPGELRRCMEPDGHDKRFHADEFVRRVARRAGVDEPAAERDARAVFAALARAVGPDEFHDMRSELPEDFDPLLDEALREAPDAAPAGADADADVKPAMAYDEFLRRVAERADVDRDSAARAADAVLKVLAYRITAGEVLDLEALLPPELRPALERGREQRATARPLDLETFIGLIARREGVDRGMATQHARAVLPTLREAVGEKEFHDMAEQLPEEYRALWKQK